MLRARNDGAPRPIRLLCATAFLLLLSAVSLRAQSQATAVSAAAVPAMARAADAETGQVNLVVGRSTVLNVGVPIMRVSLSRPEIADAVATTTEQLLIHGKAAGSITMFVWDRSGGIRRFEVTVARDLAEIEAQMQQLFPGEPIKVSGNGKDLVLSGTVSSKYIIEKAADIAAGYVEKKENVVSLLRQADSAQSNQVLLRVRFAEVSRSALTELGASLFTSALGYKNYTARTTTEQFPAPTFDSSSGESKLVFSDFLNLFLFNNKEGLGTVIHALQTKGAFQSLAEPNLVAESGKEASFLAGGEYPYPAVQGNGASLAVTIVFKEFGVRLTFTPTILGPDTVHLKVRPEVSSLDFTNAINYQGFRIPSLSTRRAETEIELQNGQTFAIAGLMNNTMTSSLQKIPGIGDIPILGLLFRSKAAQKNQSELVVMITPQILPRNSTGTADRLPTQIEPYLGAPSKGVPPPPPYLGPQKQDPPPTSNSNSTVQPPAQSRGATGVDEKAAVSVTPRATSAPVPDVSPARVVSQPQPALPPAQGAAAIAQSARPPQTAAVTTSSGPSTPPPAQAAQSVATPAPTTIVTSTATSPNVPKPDPKAAERARKAQQKRDEADAQARAKQQEQQKLQQEADARALAQKQQEEARVKAADDKRAAEQAKKDAKAAAEQAKVEKAKQDEARKQQAKLAAEQAKRDAETAKKDAETAKRQAEFERKQTQELRDAEARLKAAQAAFEAAQLKKAK